MISVESMAGNIVWGPAMVDALAPLSSLRDMVAETMDVPPPAVNLVYEDRTLQGALAEEAVPTGAAVTCVLDIVQGSIEALMMQVRTALEALNHGMSQWHLEKLVGEVPVPNEEHCPEFQYLDWRSLEYKEIMLVDTTRAVDNHAGKYLQFHRESYFGSVDPEGALAGYGFIVKQCTCWGEYNHDFRGAYHGLFLPGENYKVPQCSLTGSKLVQGTYQGSIDIHTFETYFPEKECLFDGTEAQEE